MRDVILAIPCLNDLHLDHHFYFSLSYEVSLIRESLFSVWPSGWKMTFQTILLQFLCPYLFERNSIKQQEKKGEEELSSHLSHCSLTWHLYSLQSLGFDKVPSVKPLQTTLLFPNVLVLTFLCLFPRSDILLNPPTLLCLPGLFSGGIRLADHTGFIGIYPTMHEVLSEVAQTGQKELEIISPPSNAM